MAFLEISPLYRDRFQALGLERAEQVLVLPAVVVSGHPGRNVSRVMLGNGPDTVAAFLKCEHRVTWKDRLQNALAGFGFVSKAEREAAVLRHLARMQVAAPEWIAHGVDGAGRAFVLIKEQAEGRSLGSLLARADAPERTELARRVVEAVARVHQAGVCHGDLYAKHVFVSARDGSVVLLDWQRARRTRLGRRQRIRDLATLHATLPDEWAGRRDRLVCLRAYVQSCGRADVPPLRELAREIEAERQQLLRSPRFRELRNTADVAFRPALIWKDGEALCVTPEFDAVLNGHVPDALRQPPMAGQTFVVRASFVVSANQPSARLVRRRRTSRMAGLLDRFRRREVTSPEGRQAGLSFRLGRSGIAAPTLLAFGHRRSAPGVLDSFLLTGSPAGLMPLEWCFAAADTGCRHELLRAAGEFLRRLHGTRCYFAPNSTPLGRAILVRYLPNGESELSLANLDDILLARKPDETRAVRDLARVADDLRVGRVDAARLVRAYVNSDSGLEPRRLLRRLLRTHSRWPRDLEVSA